MDPISRVIAAGAAGAGTAEAVPLYADDVFSTYVYKGTGSNHTITNGIDLSGKGGLVWIKARTNNIYSHRLYDTARGVNSNISSNLNGAASATNNTVFRAFNSDGFEIGSANDVNSSSHDYVSWTFREAPGFFDIVTWTGDTNSTKTLNHNLGSVPGCIMVKNLSLSSSDWTVYHRGLGNTKYIELNNNFAADTSSNAWNDTDPTSTQFTVGSFSNSNNSQYVAYLWAHDDQSFGANSDETIIKCDSYTGNASSDGPTINLGFEPQWVLIKNTGENSAYGSWMLFDNMRGVVDGNDQALIANRADNENSTYTGTSSGLDWIEFTSTGFKIQGPGYTAVDTNATEYIYIAIRRSHKPPTSGTDVFGIEKLSGSQSSPAFRTGIVTDMGWARRLNDGDYYGDGVGVYDRLRGDKFLATGSTAAEGSDSFDGDYMNGFYSSAISGDIGYSFKRAAGFFDIVAYNGTGSETTVTHNLGVTPELMIVKRRDSTVNWYVQSSELTSYAHSIILNSSNAAFGPSTILFPSAAPTATVFRVGSNTGSNASGGEYIAYLFASLSGISKVGTYSGSSNSTSEIEVDCGFTNGARFVLIKRTDVGTSSWYVWDGTRGINSGNDPVFFLNNASAESTITDYIEPLAAGFKVGPSASLPSALNASGGTYLFFAIA